MPHGFERTRDRETRKPLCRYCDRIFTPDDPRQEFCDKTCKQLWKDFWSSRGPRLARMLYSYRYDRKPGALSDMCLEFGDMLKAFDKKRLAKEEIVK